MPKNIVLEIARYSPEHYAAPVFENYEVPVHKEWVVLDALNHIKDKVDGSLTYRWSCRMGICGSCGMMIDGEPKLACATFLSSYANNGNKLRIEPLRYFPVVRDLVTELTGFFANLKKAKPWLIRWEESPLSAGEFLQTPEQLDNYKQYSMCINCTLCYAACPVVGLDPTFVGPAALALAQRYNKDSRDQGADMRLATLSHPDGIWGCTFVGECTRVCPKHVDPAGAIQQYKLSAVFAWAKSLVMPLGKKSKDVENADRKRDTGQAA
jgi:fumarate reductase iron-sulfur subunit